MRKRIICLFMLLVICLFEYNILQAQESPKTSQERATNMFQDFLGRGYKKSNIEFAQEMSELGDVLVSQKKFKKAWVRYGTGYMNHPTSLLFFKAGEAEMHAALLETHTLDLIFNAILDYETGYFFSTYEEALIKTVSNTCLNKTKTKIDCFKQILDVELRKKIIDRDEPISLSLENALLQCLRLEPHFFEIPTHCD